jgi:hypothetical protein
MKEKEMRRWILVAVLILLAAIGAVVVATLPEKAGLPAGCQAALSQYLAYKSAPVLTVRSTDQAAKPSNFRQEMSYTVFGDTVFYQTDVNYQEASSETEPTTTLSSGGTRPLPFPPEEVWCVLLGGGSETTSSAVVFVALHQDIYNADWVVHEAASDPFSPDSLNVASAIGCDLATDRSAQAVYHP